MKTFEANVMIQKNNARIPHVAQVQAQSVFSAKEMLEAQYGRGNVVSIPVEISTSGSSHNPAPWMVKIG